MNSYKMFHLIILKLFMMLIIPNSKLKTKLSLSKTNLDFIFIS